MKDYPIGTTFTHEGVELEAHQFDYGHCAPCYFNTGKTVGMMEGLATECGKPDSIPSCDRIIKGHCVIFKEAKPKTA